MFYESGKKLFATMIFEQNLKSLVKNIKLQHSIEVFLLHVNILEFGFTNTQIVSQYVNRTWSALIQYVTCKPRFNQSFFEQFDNMLLWISFSKRLLFVNFCDERLPTYFIFTRTNLFLVCWKLEQYWTLSISILAKVHVLPC